jgi:hypothetical protein
MAAKDELLVARIIPTVLFRIQTEIGKNGITSLGYCFTCKTNYLRRRLEYKKYFSILS